jgi:hypothetical protein
MKILVCIDDTDSLDSRGTGELADELAREVEKRSWGRCHSITRHQLFVHPDIPYTSHNSSMCFVVALRDELLGRFTDYAAEFLVRESASGSDPGLCVAVADCLTRPDILIEFGYRAKRSVLTMDDAYELAADMGVHLSSHGGTGQGIIGALAGVGLRLGGNDGRLRGSIVIPSENGLATVAEILTHPEVDEVRTMEGVALPDTARVRFSDKVKTVLLGGKFVLLVVAEKDQDGVPGWCTCTRQQLKCY